MERYGILTNVHEPAACEGRGCVIHHPSDNHMRDWPKVWRNGRKVFERTCPHGIGHTDLDDVAYVVSIGQGWRATHGCDGCCVETARGEDRTCPYSGLTVLRCKRVDLCDCFDFPEL